LHRDRNAVLTALAAAAAILLTQMNRFRRRRASSVSALVRPWSRD